MIDELVMVSGSNGIGETGSVESDSESSGVNKMDAYEKVTSRQQQL